MCMPGQPQKGLRALAVPTCMADRGCCPTAGQVFPYVLHPNTGSPGIVGVLETSRGILFKYREQPESFAES